MKTSMLYNVNEHAPIFLPNILFMLSRIFLVDFISELLLQVVDREFRMDC